jgi:hypothetical protein
MLEDRGIDEGFVTSLSSNVSSLVVDDNNVGGPELVK